MKFHLAIVLTAAMTCAAHAQSMEEARQLMTAGNYAEAQSMLDILINSSPRGANAGQLNLLAGECALRLQDTEAALNYLNKAAARGVADAYLHIAHMAMEEYDFDKARELYNKYVTLRDKAGKSTEAGEAGMAAATAGADMLDRVEKIEVIDTVHMPLDKLASMLPLSAETGSLLADDKGHTGFISSDRRLKYTSAPAQDTVPGMRIFEQTLLLSGEYDTPEMIMDPDMDASYPFMMPDGCTFYFASEREGGLGGLDIYRSNRDAEEGTFMGAVNMGMPYNSPANDYLLAIDEYTGVGWIVSDRENNADGMVTAYIFIPQEIRENYDPDATENLISFARLDDITATQNPESDYTPLLQSIEELRRTETTDAPYITFTMPDGRVISDFPDRIAQRAAAQYTEDKIALERLREELSSLRRQYAAGRSERIASRIIDLEQTCLSRQKTLRQQKQQLIELLSK